MTHPNDLTHTWGPTVRKIVYQRKCSECGLVQYMDSNAEWDWKKTWKWSRDEVPRICKDVLMDKVLQ